MSNPDWKPGDPLYYSPEMLLAETLDEYDQIVRECEETGRLVDEIYVRPLFQLDDFDSTLDHLDDLCTICRPATQRKIAGQLIQLYCDTPTNAFRWTPHLPAEWPNVAEEDFSRGNSVYEPAWGTRRLLKDGETPP